MSAQLVPIRAGSGSIVNITRPVILIGRHIECDVRLDSPQVSRRHCCLALAYDRLVIRDLGSRNGVRVNGQVVEEAHLKSGDEIAISQFLYRLEGLEKSVEPARPQKPAPPGTSFSDLPPLIDLSDDFIPLDD